MGGFATGRRAILAVITISFAANVLSSQPDEEKARSRVHELREEKKYGEALALLDTLVLQYPESAQLRAIYPWIYLDDLDSPETALERALGLKADFPDYSGGYYWEAKVLERTGDYAGCLRALHEYPDFDRQYRRHAVTAGCHYMLGQWTEALAALLTADELGLGYQRYEGWHFWLRGQIAKRPIFEAQKEELRAAAQSPDPRQRAVAVVKLGILAIPEAAELVELASQGASGELQTATANLSRILTARPLFYRERAKPTSLPDARSVPLEKALATIWAELDQPPEPGAIPPVEGAWLTEQMAAMAKSYPAAAQPMRIQVNDSRDQYSMGPAWINVTGEIDMSFEPGRWYSFQCVRDGALRSLSVGLRKEGTDITRFDYRRQGDNLVLHTTGWVEMGETYLTYSYPTTFLPFEG